MMGATLLWEIIFNESVTARRLQQSIPVEATNTPLPLPLPYLLINRIIRSINGINPLTDGINQLQNATHTNQNNNEHKQTLKKYPKHASLRD